MSLAVRVDEDTHERLRVMAERDQESMGVLIAKAIRLMEDQRFWAVFNEGVDALRADPVAWQEELEERRLWETTLGDDLQDDPYPLDGLVDDAKSR